MARCLHVVLIMWIINIVTIDMDNIRQERPNESDFEDK